MSSGGIQKSIGNFLAGGGELGGLMRARDWAATQLGTPESWPNSLKLAIRIMLTSLQPIWIGWGRELIYFYNDAYTFAQYFKSNFGINLPRYHSMEYDALLDKASVEVDAAKRRALLESGERAMLRDEVGARDAVAVEEDAIGAAARQDRESRGGRSTTPRARATQPRRCPPADRL